MAHTDITKIFIETNALLEGHFLLTSGKHSNQYFQCAKVLQFPFHMEVICSNIADFFRSYQFDTVISPALGGILVGQEVARQLAKRSIFAEREDKVLTLRRGFTVAEGERFLVCEDVVTTGGSVLEVIDIVKKNGGIVVGVGAIVDRSNGKVDFGSPFFASIKMNVVAYQPDECPLCKASVPIVKPGSRKVTNQS